MKSFIESEVKSRANLIDRRRRMPQFLKYRTAINIMKEIIMLIGLIREAPNISKYISERGPFPFVATRMISPGGGVVGRDCLSTGEVEYDKGFNYDFL